MGKNKASLLGALGAMLAASSQTEWEKTAFESFNSDENFYKGKGHSTPIKTKLTKKQSKARAKSKRARKSRKK